MSNKSEMKAKYKTLIRKGKKKEAIKLLEKIRSNSFKKKKKSKVSSKKIKSEKGESE